MLIEDSWQRQQLVQQFWGFVLRFEMWGCSWEPFEDCEVWGEDSNWGP